MKMTKLWLVLVAILVSHCLVHVQSDRKEKQEKRTYLVHMDKSDMPTNFDDHSQWFATSLRTASQSAKMLYTYNNIIHGFSSRLTTEEAESLKRQHGVLSVQAEVIYKLHTTRTPEFLGLGKSGALLPQSSSVSEVIVGILDTGVWPEMEGFDDTGLGPVPTTWKGSCQVGKDFNSSSCNRKLIGARFFSAGYEASSGPIDETVESKSPRDNDGHGTHTSTTAAGSAVSGANFLNFASGTARGMASSARVAAYKVCWVGGCFGTDILAAMEKAIEDGVHILSLSLGGGVADYYRDIVAIGAFAATAQGIFVSCSAGNSGPSAGSLSNIAPWITTVGAGTLDRDFPAYITLGNGRNFSGESLYGGESLPSSLHPLVYSGNASNTSTGFLCMTGTLIPEKVAGKIVICERGVNSRVQKGAVVKASGGIGMIFINSGFYGEETVADAHLLPTSAIGQKSGDFIKNYVSMDPNPTATITSGGTKFGVQLSPVVATFSSRGPNPITPKVLKPDLMAPGVNILAGWSGATAPTGLKTDTRRVNFNIISGTSMSCPHVSGLAALVKAAHPGWSPAAIRSALMTTAYTTYSNGKIIQDAATGTASTPFDIGSGHVDPVSALDPGLVYDITLDGYLGFLCALKYTASEIKQIAKKDFTCKTSKNHNVEDLNYPSFAVPLQSVSQKGGSSTASTTVKYTRTLSNVGSSSTYMVSVSSPPSGVKILIEPESLTFNELYEKKNYTMTVVASSMPSGTISFAHLEWSDGKHNVRSPVAFRWT